MMTYRSNHPPDESDLSLFEMPAWLVRPAVAACRRFNTVVDKIFYDVPALQAGDGLPASSLGALDDPEGALLLIDAAAEPHVTAFHDVPAYLGATQGKTGEAEIVTITGVGSSALGSAAFAWDISKALGKPVLAIVPGYGVADMVLQGLGGWFGFGLHDALGLKGFTQTALASIAPRTAAIGRRLSGSVPDAATLNGAPVFRYGSGSSDVLHALMGKASGPFKMAIGHSKGALQIGNALRSLDPLLTEEMHVVTLGCPIAEDAPGAKYFQYLGLFDALGQMNMWGHWPEHWVPAWHSTNPHFPPAMAAGALARNAV